MDTQAFDTVLSAIIKLKSNPAPMPKLNFESMRDNAAKMMIEKSQKECNLMDESPSCILEMEN